MPADRHGRPHRDTAEDRFAQPVAILVGGPDDEVDETAFHFLGQADGSPRTTS